MAWLRIDDTVPEHRKMLQAGPAACWLWVCGIAYCQRQLSDGFIPSAALFVLGVIGSRSKVIALADALVRVGLFDRVEDGYIVHDYHDHNATRDEALARKEDIQRKRSAAGKRGAEARWQNGKRVAPGNSKPIAPSHPSTKNPPTPLDKGGRVTRAERKRAEELRRLRFGCTHEPRCLNAEACIETIVLGLREQAATA